MTANRHIDRLREALGCVLWPTELEMSEADAALDALAADLDAAIRERDEWRRDAVERSRAESAEARVAELEAALREALDLLDDTSHGEVHDGQQEWQNAYARIHDAAGKPQREGRRPWELAAAPADSPFAECICPVEGCLVHPAAPAKTERSGHGE